MKPSLPDPASGMELSPARVAELLPEIVRGGITLIDCREEDEWRINRLPGARLIPLAVLGASPLPPAVPVIVYCHHGMRSLRATARLRERGIDAWSMSGGIDRWSAEIDPAVPVY